MSITVRRATSADAGLLSPFNAEIQAIHAAALPSWFKPPGPQTFSPAAAAALVDNPNNLVFVAEDGADPAGYVYAGLTRHAETPSRYASEIIYIHQIGVRAAHRRRADRRRARRGGEPQCRIAGSRRLVVQCRRQGVLSTAGFCAIP